MATLHVDTLNFHFDANVRASKYDEWRYHESRNNKKAVDVVAVRKTVAPPVCWLIEVKDYRMIRGTPNVADLPVEVASKMVDTAEGLKEAAAAAEIAAEKSHAALAIKAATTRVVLHLEPYAGAKTKLFPTPPNPANVLQKLKSLVASLDYNPLVLNMANTARAGVPWSVTSLD